MSAVYLQQFPSYSNHNCKKIVIFTYPGFHFLFALGTPLWQVGNHAKRCMNEKTIIQCLPNPSQHIPIYLEQFRSYLNRKCKKIAVFTYRRLAAHIFVSPGDAPAIITQYVAWMERQFKACQTPSSMYPSIFNSFPVIRTAKNRHFHVPQPTFLFPLGLPWGNHAKCCMDGKRIRCLQIVSQHVPACSRLEQSPGPHVQGLDSATMCQHVERGRTSTLMKTMRVKTRWSSGKFLT